MGKVSGYAQKRQDELVKARNHAAKVAQDLTMQLLTDCLCLALHDRSWGEARLWELLQSINEIWKYYTPVIFDVPQTRKEILDSKAEEYREDLDRRLSSFLHEHYADFYTRYGPWIRAPDYDSLNPKSKGETVMHSDTCETCIHFSTRMTQIPHPWTLQSFCTITGDHVQPDRDPCAHYEKLHLCEECEHYQWLSDEDLRDRWCLKLDVCVGDEHPACDEFEPFDGGLVL